VAPVQAVAVDDLDLARDDDPLLTHLLAYRIAGTPAYRLDGAVLFRYDYWSEVSAQVIGPASAGARLVAELAPVLTDVGGVSVPADSVPLLPHGLFAPERDWRFRWTDRRPEAPGQPAGWLTDDDRRDVEELLRDGFVDASVWPGDRRARRWAGIRDDSGRLVACAADCTASEVGFMASVASRRSARGTGVGLAVTCWLTHALLDDYPRVGLWQYDDNVVATAVYDRLGYRDDHLMVAGALTPAG
jgi:hypothetical protein